MSRLSDENEQLDRLLRAIPAPAPAADFLAATRQRYRVALDARDRREIWRSLAAGLLGLVLLAVLVAPSVQPTVLVAWLAEAAADLARWMTGAAVVLALVPPTFWVATALGFVACTLSLVRLSRARSLALVK